MFHRIRNHGQKQIEITPTLPFLGLCIENMREHELLAPAAAGRFVERPRGPPPAGRHLRRLCHRWQREQVTTAQIRILQS